MPESEDAPVYVLDASVLINFLGCGAADDILRTLPGQAWMEQRALAEVLLDPGRRLPSIEQREALIESGALRAQALCGVGIERFLALVSDEDRLDDGEAATIACALQLGGVAALDERKGRRVARERFRDLVLISTAGLFRTLVESGSMPEEQVRMLIVAALQKARMSVPSEDVDWVIGQVGVEVAEQCPSIRRSAIRRFRQRS